MEEELDAVLEGKKAEKLQASTIYLLKYGKQENLKIYFFDYTMLCINKTQQRNVRKASSSPKKGNFGITKRYGSMSLNVIPANVYNTLLLSRIRPEVEKILGENQNGFRRNRSTTPDLKYPSNHHSRMYKNHEATPKYLIPYREERSSKYNYSVNFMRREDFTLENLTLYGRFGLLRQLTLHVISERDCQEALRFREETIRVHRGEVLLTSLVTWSPLRKEIQKRNATNPFVSC